MDSLIVQGFRCFGKRVEVPLRPLTLLVGENSTGKTTFLGVVRLAWDLAAANRLNFREAPFDFGHVTDFRHDGPSTGPMTVGFTGKYKSRTPVATEMFSFCCDLIDLDGEVAPCNYRLETLGGSMAVSRLASEKLSVTLTRTDALRAVRTVELPWTFFQRGLGWFAHLAFEVGGPDGEGSSGAAFAEELGAFEIDRAVQRWGRPFANAPVRARPERVYSPGQLTAEPEGSHTPVVLAKLLSRGNGEAARARELILGFGKASGLFSSLDVRQFGDGKSGDPFQVLFGIEGQKRTRNAIDVGYGISQVLPLLVDLVTLETSTFLLQDPEVHLHPRAQAEVGSLLLREASKGRQFIVETHSDFIVDRVCMDVRDGKAKAEDVQILFFERTDGEVAIHPISVDQQGNIVGAPPHYRAFFEHETSRYLGVGDVHHH